MRGRLPPRCRLGTSCPLDRRWHPTCPHLTFLTKRANKTFSPASLPRNIERLRSEATANRWSGGRREGWLAMNDVARIAYNRGAFYLAASTPYERELVLEHSALCARRHHTAQLRL